VLLRLLKRANRQLVFSYEGVFEPMRFLERWQRATLGALLGTLAWGLLAAAPALAENGPRLPPFEADESEARKYDWVQLESGEWIKGSITRLHDEKLEFDSDEFDDVSIDWGDVASVIPSGVMTVRLPDRRVVTGYAEMRDGVVTIDTGSEVITAKREDIIGMIVGEDTESGYWSGGASLGLTARAGNTQQMDFTVRAGITRQTALTRAKASYTGEISSANNDTTANSHRVPAQFDIFLTRRFFLSAPAFEYFTDEFQNIGSRFTAGLGVGYDVIDRAKLLWTVGGGVAYQYTGFESVAPGEEETANDGAIVFTTGLELDLPRGIEWDNYYKVQVIVTDIGKTSHHAESILSFDVWGPLELDLTFIFDRVEDPVTIFDPDDPANSATPESNDYRLTAGLGLDF